MSEAAPVTFTAKELTDLRTLCARAAYDSADDARNDAPRHLVTYNRLGALLDNMTAQGANIATIMPHQRKPKGTKL